MSKPRESKPKVNKPRYPNGRFIKSTSKIPFDLFGDKKTPPTNPTLRYARSETQRGQSPTAKITESQ